jgi:hypothetical protein
MLSSSAVIILEKISPTITPVEEMDTVSNLNSQVPEFHIAIVKRNESFKVYMGGSEQH